VNGSSIVSFGGFNACANKNVVALSDVIILSNDIGAPTSQTWNVPTVERLSDFGFDNNPYGIRMFMSPEAEYYVRLNGVASSNATLALSI